MSDEYLIWSNEHQGWWGPNHFGYVKRACDAGRYSRDEALAICHRAIGTAFQMRMPAELPVRLQDLKDFVTGTVPEFMAPVHQTGLHRR